MLKRLKHITLPITACLLLAACKDSSFPERQHPELAADILVDSDFTPGIQGGSFVFADAAQPSSFNPLVATDAYSMRALEQILAPLIRYDYHEQTFEPSLATHWDISEDKLTYTIYLRKGVQWSDGHPFSADDVIFTLDTIFDERYPTRSKNQLSVGADPIRYRKLDDYTIEIKTPKPYSPLLFKLSDLLPLPKHALQASVDDGSFQSQWTLDTATNRPASILATGPYVLHSFRSGQRMLMTPNPYYWKTDSQGTQLPYIDLLVQEFVQDPNTALMLLTAGELDFSEIRQVSNIGWIEQIASERGLRLIDNGPSASLMLFWFNQNPSTDDKGLPFIPPYKLAWFTDKRFRQAIQYGYNRQGVLDALAFGRGVLLNSPISPANKRWYNPAVNPYPYDPSKAAQLLKEAGFTQDTKGKLHGPAGNPVIIKLMAAETARGGSATLSIFKEDMSALGIEVELQMMDFSTILATMDSQKYEMGSLGFTASPDPSGGKDLYESDGRFHLWHPSQKAPTTPWEKRIDAIMAEQENSFDYVYRKELFDELQMIFSDQQPMQFIIAPNEYFGIKDQWQNVYIPSLGSPLWSLETWWNGSLQTEATQ